MTVMKEKKIKILWSMAMAISLLLLWGGGIGYAMVTGFCGTCHTMHNMQGGAEVVADGPYDRLLINTCIGCHTGTNNGSNTIPYVMSDVTLTKANFGSITLAGGNFWWVATAGGNTGGDDDAKGHNVLGVSNQDLAITVGDGAPGHGLGFNCGAVSCHNTLAVASTSVNDGGCEGCHVNVMHHTDDGTGTKYVDAPPWYRFLSGHVGSSGYGHGVKGIEHSGWGYNATVGGTNHNEYLGTVADKDSAGGFSGIDDTMTGFCTGCHGNFHIQDATATGATPWIRHPSDFVIPDTEGSEYASMSLLYNPNTPVARSATRMAELGDNPSAAVAPGTDMVMCLSCHVPHGSPYDDLLRWNYATMNAGGGSNTTGCFVCHTSKDGVSGS